MKIAVIGTGAMGAIYAARLAEAGADLWAIDRWTDHVRAIQADGLRVAGPNGLLHSRRVRARETLAEAGRCDLYVIATKANQVADAAAAIAALDQPCPLVLTIQNGLGSGERLRACLPDAEILIGVAEAFGAQLTGPGRAEHRSEKQLRFGHLGGGVIRPRLTEVAALWQRAGFSVALFEDIEQLIWEKLLCNVTLSAPCAYFGCTIAQLRADRERWAVALACVAEAAAVADRLGLRFGFASLDAYVTAFADRLGNAKPSLLQDHEARRRSELAFINGAIVRLAGELGLPAPVNARLCSALEAREAGWA